MKKECPANVNLFASPDIDLGVDIAEAETVNLYLHRTTAVALMGEMTADQLMRTIGDLAFLTTQLTAKLADAVKTHEVNRQFETDEEEPLPTKLLKLAEIPDGATLDVEISKGEIHIIMAENDENEGIDDDFPIPILEYLSDCGISIPALRRTIESDERIQI